MSTKWMALAMVIALVTFPACSKQSVERAGQGAATGAVVGAVGGMVSALVFGGNVADAAARGAVWGGSTGAAAGAMSGAVADNNQKKAQQANELETLKKQLGEDAFQGLDALVQCKHEVAQGYGRTAAKSDNQDYALAGLWLQVLAYADSRQEEKARALFPDLVSEDSKISSASQAETEMRKALQKLKDIRQEYNLPNKQRNVE
ncbi:MAG: hypothetical protein HGJ93_18850 [Desulfosarcina sp.]|nr:hypothetical protein [Desulfosarcina sp.]MBC2767927.1 hypothetical protein [Desulfosarcina sp.]